MYVEQGVAIIYERGSLRTLWNLHCLAVTGYQEPVIHGGGAGETHLTWNTVRSWGARVSSGSLWPRKARISFGPRLTVISRNAIFTFWPWNTCHTLLSFLSREPRWPLGSREAMRPWEPNVSFDGDAGAGGTRGAYIALFSWESSVSNFSFESNVPEITPCTWEARDTLQSPLSLLSINTWKARLSRKSRNSRVTLMS